MDRVPLLRVNRSKVRAYWEKTDSEVEEHIESIKEWIITQDFPEMPTDHMIEFFLTNCKYDIGKTKINIGTYYSIREEVPEIYKNSNPKLPEMQEAWDMGCYVPLPTALDDMYRISITVLSSNASKFDVAKYYANVMNIYEVRICEDLTVSEIAVVDYKQLTWTHLFRFTPMLKKIIYIMKNVAKNRIQKMHVVQSPAYMGMLITLSKKFMTKKLGDRIQVHTTLESLYEHIPQELLPSDYGGKQPPLNDIIDKWKKKVEEYQDRFDMWDRATNQENLV